MGKRTRKINLIKEKSKLEREGGRNFHRAKKEKYKVNLMVKINTNIFSNI